MKSIINSCKRTHWFKASVSLLTCIVFLMLPSCQKDELNQGSMLNMDNLSTSPLSKPIKDKIKRGTVTDVAGNDYKTVLIGKQWWMAENLAYLPAVNLPTEESVTNPYYYVYDYIGEDVDAAKATDNYKTYGVLYNWTAAMAACPTGWHIPSDAEWTVLSDYLIKHKYAYEGSGDDIAFSLSAQTNWQNTGLLGSPGGDLASNNSSGFSGLPSGWRFYTDDNGTPGYFEGINGIGAWWSSTYGADNVDTDTWIRMVTVYETNLWRQRCAITFGMNVRCVKD